MFTYSYISSQIVMLSCSPALSPSLSSSIPRSFSSLHYFPLSLIHLWHYLFFTSFLLFTNIPYISITSILISLPVFLSLYLFVCCSMTYWMYPLFLLSSLFHPCLSIIFFFSLPFSTLITPFLCISPSSLPLCLSFTYTYLSLLVFFFMWHFFFSCSYLSPSPPLHSSSLPLPLSPSSSLFFSTSSV